MSNISTQLDPIFERDRWILKIELKDKVVARRKQPAARLFR